MTRCLAESVTLGRGYAQEVQLTLQHRLGHALCLCTTKEETEKTKHSQLFFPSIRAPTCSLLPPGLLTFERAQAPEGSLEGLGPTSSSLNSPYNTPFTRSQAAGRTPCIPGSLMSTGVESPAFGAVQGTGSLPPPSGQDSPYRRNSSVRRPVHKSQIFGHTTLLPAGILSNDQVADHLSRPRKGVSGL